MAPHRANSTQIKGNTSVLIRPTRQHTVLVDNYRLRPHPTPRVHPAAAVPTNLSGALTSQHQVTDGASPASVAYLRRGGVSVRCSSTNGGTQRLATPYRCGPPVRGHHRAPSAVSAMACRSSRRGCALQVKQPVVSSKKYKSRFMGKHKRTRRVVACTQPRCNERACARPMRTATAKMALLSLLWPRAGGCPRAPRRNRLHGISTRLSRYDCIV